MEADEKNRLYNIENNWRYFALALDAQARLIQLGTGGAWNSIPRMIRQARNGIQQGVNVDDLLSELEFRIDAITRIWVKDLKTRLANLRAQWQQYRISIGGRDEFNELKLGEHGTAIPVLMQQAQFALQSGEDIEEQLREISARLEEVRAVVRERNIDTARFQAPTDEQIANIQKVYPQDAFLEDEATLAMRFTAARAAQLAQHLLQERFHENTADRVVEPGEFVGPFSALSADDRENITNTANRLLLSQAWTDEVDTATVAAREFRRSMRETNRIHGMAEADRFAPAHTRQSDVEAPFDADQREVIRNNLTLAALSSPGNALGIAHRNAALEAKMAMRRATFNAVQAIQRARDQEWRSLSPLERARWGLSIAEADNLTTLAGTLETLAAEGGVVLPEDAPPPGEETAYGTVAQSAINFANRIVVNMRSTNRNERLTGIDELVQLKYPEKQRHEDSSDTPSSKRPRTETKEREEKKGSGYMRAKRRRYVL